MRIEHLKYIIAITNKGSINRASKALYINQQQLSKIVHNLEEELGVKIFNRYSNGVKLTAEGKEVYEAANTIVNTVDDLYIRLHNQVNLKGNLDIKTSLSYWDQNLIYQTYDKFVMLYPNVNVSINEMHSSKIIELCGQDENIVGFISTSNSPFFSRKIEMPEKCLFVYLCNFSLGIYVSKENSYAKANKAVAIESLKDEDFVVYAINGESSFDYCLSKIGHKKYSVSKINRFHEIIRNDKAIAFGINWGEKFFEENDIAFVPLMGNIVVTSGMIIPKYYRKNPLIKAFVELCQKQAKDIQESFEIKI